MVVSQNVGCFLRLAFANVALQDKQVTNAYSRHTTCLTNYTAKIFNNPSVSHAT